ncbi:conserved hypothetical protein [Histoplasma capsulatum G186AR]|uniref:Rhodopsin domain-containing protein n=1 Tax=Ajellomyces capsulatus (strain G186AR / H82 / ATCC MYA-2454 / RMSCC 2432) TaxID=447093 RepID=C0NVY9_AJECG|nr:uncharacterized protein HCBG_07319 [Histoplasma capsulatum G186AR]EEH04678.1 conserved hypothetical protein [Histoplasma capsulatum G186AR]
MFSELVGKPQALMTPETLRKLAEWPFFAICTVLMAIRLGFRLRFVRRLFWEDTFATFGYAFLLAIDIVALYCIHHIEAYETLVVESPRWHHHFNAMLKLSFTVDVLYNCIIYAIKASFLALMWRIFKNIPGFRRPWWVVTITTVVLGLTSLSLEPATCVKFYLVMALPISFIAKSRLPWTQKLGIICLFSLGLIIVATSLIRIISLNYPGVHPPVSWKVFWAMIESSIAVMTSCFSSYGSLYTFLKRSNNPRRRPSYTGGEAWPKHRHALAVVTEAGGVQDGTLNDGESTVNILSQIECERPGKPIDKNRLRRWFKIPGQKFEPRSIVTREKVVNCVKAWLSS